MRICFDLDGTLVNLYGVENWLTYLKNENTKPYLIATPLINLNSLARRLNQLQAQGHKIVIISWLSKNGSENYNEAVTKAKKVWLKKHLKSVCFDEINIIKYGTPKSNFCNSFFDVLFDDEEQNRKNWNGIAYDEQNILEILKSF